MDRGVDAARGPEALYVFIAVADDLFRVGLARLLAKEGLAVTPEAGGSVAIVDAGADAVDARYVVALCDDPEEDGIEALRRGASVVLDRASSPELIAAAIRVAAAGAAVMPSPTAERLLTSYDSTRADMPSIEPLSPRETEVMSLVIDGQGNDQIAHELTITASTVKNHVARIMDKLGARNRTEAAVIATRLRAGG